MPARRRLAHIVSLLGRRPEREMDEEIDAHLQLRVDALMRQGLSLADAEAEARRRFGDLDAARRTLRAGARDREASMRRHRRVESLIADGRVALRQARRSPGFTLLAVLTLALGLGLTTATFTVVRGVLLRPLPFAHPERLVAMAEMDSSRRSIHVVSSGDWIDWKRDSRALDGTALHFARRMSVLDDTGAELVAGEMVSGNFFAVLGASFVAGRAFTEAEGQASAPVAAVSEGFWRRALGASPTLPIVLRFGAGRRVVSVVGVVRAGHEYPRGTDVWVPVAFQPEVGAMRNNVNWEAIGRLAPGITLARATDDLDRISRDIRTRDPAALYAYGVDVRPLATEIVGDAATYLPMLLAAVSFVLLIVCANLAAATLARGASRVREMALRAALGASRGRLVQQLLMEHLALAAVAGALAIAIAWLAVRMVVIGWGAQIPRIENVAIDGGVLAFSVALTFATGLLAGSLPAVAGSRASLQRLMTRGSRTAARGGRNIPGAGLVAAELAIALVLLTGAGLLIRSFTTLLARDLGFDASAVTVEATLAGPRYETQASRLAYWDRLEKTLGEMPRARAAGVANWVPLGMGGTGFIDVEGKQLTRPGAGYRVVSDGYFAALGVSLVAGRTFGAQDVAAGPRVVVINRRMATMYWPGESPIGQRVRATTSESGSPGRDAPWLTVIGVVGDVRHWGLDAELAPEMYVLHRQAPEYWSYAMSAIVRGASAGTSLVNEARVRAKAVDPTVAVDVSTLAAKLDASVAERRLTMTLLTAFGGIALLLAAIGIYGVLSYGVAQRTRELAVRSALGARRDQLVMLVLRGALRIIALGTAAGLLAAYAVTRAMTRLLVDVAPHDPASFVVAAVVLATIALAAAAIPALAATRLDPAVTLQAE